ncbi:hypothetical protein quinque_009942 [Culex quinquefasciatus]|uniref:uncharacterized protein LOC120413553 n=1 Tax=Culex pipiens pallens TaxID=42434 RepID=UPI0019531DD3|nr:uncharacterized protein LOC120413553 [Culex pipiens pallens]
MPRVPAVVFSAPSITGGESSGAASGSSTADGTSPSTDNHCERNHKFYAKVSIDFGLLITTLVQMRVVVGEDRKKDYMMVYLLYLFIAISLAVQIAVLLAYVSLHFVRHHTPCTRLKFFLSQGIFLITVLNVLSACLVEALVELPAEKPMQIPSPTTKIETLLN